MSRRCQHRDSVVLLADGELTEDAANEVRTHVGGCETCSATLDGLKRLEAFFAPQAGRSSPVDASMAETRFWRMFDADLALRVNRRRAPFWRRAIVLPVPAAAALGACVIALGAMVMHQREEATRLSARNARLEASLRTVLDESVYAFSPRLVESLAALEADRADRAVEERGAPPATAELASGGGAAALRSATRPLPDVRFYKAPVFQASRRIEPGTQIRFVDSELSAPADFY